MREAQAPPPPLTLKRAWLCRRFGSSRCRGRLSKESVETRQHPALRHVHVVPPVGHAFSCAGGGGGVVIIACCSLGQQGLAPRWACANPSKRANREAHSTHPSFKAALSRRRSYPRGEQRENISIQEILITWTSNSRERRAFFTRAGPFGWPWWSGSVMRIWPSDHEGTWLSGPSCRAELC